MAEEDDELDQDELAAAWGAALDDAESEGGEGTKSQLASLLNTDDDAAQSRLLTQEEVDALVGFDPDNQQINNVTGIRALADSSVVSHERLPMLDIIFDRLVRLLTSSLRNFTSDNVEVSVEEVSFLRFEDYLEQIELPAIVGVFKANEWNNYGMICLEANLVYGVVDILLGGRSIEMIKVEARPFTMIENALVTRLIGVILNDASGAFTPLTDVTFSLDRLETNPRFATIARENDACVMVNLRLEMENRGGRVEMLLPNSTLEPIRSLLLQGFLGERFGQDSIWEEHLASEIWKTTVPIEVILDENELSLDQIMGLKVGDTLPLNVKEQSNVVVRSGHIDLAKGKMGQRDGKIAVRLNQKIRANLDFPPDHLAKREVA